MSKSTDKMRIVALYILPVIILIIYAVNIIMSLIYGSTPPRGLRCIGGQNTSIIQAVTPSKITIYPIDARSRLMSDINFDASKEYTTSDNFRSIGLWNLLKGAQIVEGSNFKISVKGEIIRKTSNLEANLIYDKNILRSLFSINSVKKGDKIVILLDMDSYIEVDRNLVDNDKTCAQVDNDISKCRFYDGSHIEIFNNNIMLKSYDMVFTGLEINGPQLLSSDILTDNQISALKQKLQSKYVSQIFEIEQDGYFYVKLNNNSKFANSEITNGSYKLLIGQNSDIIKNGIKNDNKSIVQISFRDDNAPENWVRGGVNNSPTSDINYVDSNFIRYKSPHFSQIWVRIDDDDYSDNVGKYDIILEQSDNPVNSKISNFINKIYQEYQSTLSNGMIKIYTNIVNNNIARNIVNYMLILYVIIYGIAFIFGLTRKTHQEFGTFIFKISLVSIMFSNKSWNFFSKYLLNIFIHGPFALLNKANNISNLSQSFDLDNKFSFIDNMLNIFINENMLIILFGLISSPLIGWMIAYILLYVIFDYILVIFDIVGQIFINVIVVSLVIAVSPIFFSLILFNHTKPMFDKVIGLLADSVLKILILFVGLAVLGQIVLIYFGQILGTEACWSKYFTILSVDFYSYQISALSSNPTYILKSVISFYIISSFIKKFTEFVPEISSLLTNTFNSFFRRNSASAFSASPREWGENLLTSIGLREDKTRGSRDMTRKLREKSTKRVEKLEDSVKRHIDRGDKIE